MGTERGSSSPRSHVQVSLCIVGWERQGWEEGPRLNPAGP